MSMTLRPYRARLLLDPPLARSISRAIARSGLDIKLDERVQGDADAARADTGVKVEASSPVCRLPMQKFSSRHV